MGRATPHNVLNRDGEITKNRRQYTLHIIIHSISTVFVREKPFQGHRLFPLSLWCLFVVPAVVVFFGFAGRSRNHFQCQFNIQCIHSNI